MDVMLKIEDGREFMARLADRERGYPRYVVWTVAGTSEPRLFEEVPSTPGHNRAGNYTQVSGNEVGRVAQVSGVVEEMPK